MNGSLARQLRAIPGSKSQKRLLRRQYTHSGPEQRSKVRAILDRINGVQRKGGKVIEFELRGHEMVAKEEQHGSQSIKKLISDSRSGKDNN